MSFNKKKYSEMLDDLCCDYCDKSFCILKEFLISSHPSPRLLTQMKCVEKFRFEIGAKEDREISWSEGMELWVDSGKAKLFADFYDEDLAFRELYKKILDN